MKTYNLAVLDDRQILRGFEQVESVDKWKQTKDRFPVPDECDLAIGRYALVEFRPGKFRFEALQHRKDGADENNAEGINALAAAARSIIALAGGGKPSTADIGRLVVWLGTYDAKEG